MCFFDIAGLRLMLGPIHDGKPRTNSVLYFGVKDVERIHHALKTAGTRVVVPPRHLARLGDRDL